MTKIVKVKAATNQELADIVRDHISFEEFPGCCGAMVVSGFPSKDDHVFYGDNDETRGVTVAERTRQVRLFTKKVRSKLRLESKGQAVGIAYAYIADALAANGWIVSRPWTNPTTRNRLVNATIGLR